MEYVYTNPEDELIDSAAEEIEDAEQNILYNSSTDIDYVGNITDEDVESSSYDPDEESDIYDDNDTIVYTIPVENTDECEEDYCDDCYSDDEEDEDDYDDDEDILNYNEEED